MNLEREQEYHRARGRRIASTLMASQHKAEPNEVFLIGNERFWVKRELTEEEYFRLFREQQQKPPFTCGLAEVKGNRAQPVDTDLTEPPKDCCLYFYELECIQRRR